MIFFCSFLAIACFFLFHGWPFVGGSDKRHVHSCLNFLSPGFPPAVQLFPSLGIFCWRGSISINQNPSEFHRGRPNDVVLGLTLTGSAIHALCLTIVSLSPSRRFWKKESLLFAAIADITFSKSYNIALLCWPCTVCCCVQTVSLWQTASKSLLLLVSHLSWIEDKVLGREYYVSFELKQPLLPTSVTFTFT
jgi:hypothetical protein